MYTTFSIIYSWLDISTVIAGIIFNTRGDNNQLRKLLLNFTVFVNLDTHVAIYIVLFIDFLLAIS